jgi:CheY-like chemotaxis protein
MDKRTNCVIPAAAVGIAAQPRPPSQDGITARVLPDDNRLRVLIADDDADTADSLAMLLKIWGYEVWTAYTGGEALAMAFRFQPDVLLTDVAMPDLDGLGLARAIRHQSFLDDVLLVAMTGYADDAHRQLGLRAGFDHYLVKPVEPAVIGALLLLTAGVRTATRIVPVAGGGVPPTRNGTFRRMAAELPGEMTAEGVFASCPDR